MDRPIHHVSNSTAFFGINIIEYITKHPDKIDSYTDMIAEFLKYNDANLTIESRLFISLTQSDLKNSKPNFEKVVNQLHDNLNNNSKYEGEIGDNRINNYYSLLELIGNEESIKLVKKSFENRRWSNKWEKINAEKRASTIEEKIRERLKNSQK